ncbi:MAG: ribonuclease P protein component [Candidatus Daviesbacteria bacterium]|nr:MAG: ribonuclease P protein component [Candidatus Daviesbacteria bacterium]
MLPKLNRLNLKFQFKEVITGGKVSHKFGNVYLKYGDNNKPKIGVALTTKVFKKAHERNRAKRVISAAFEKMLVKLPANINILVVPNAEVLKVKSEELLKEYENIIH